MAAFSDNTIRHFLLAMFLLVTPPTLAAGSVVPPSNASDDSAGITIVKPTSTSVQNFSGDRQHATVGSKLKRPLRVRVLWNGASAVSNSAVRFSMVSVPDGSEGGFVEPEIARSNVDGLAECRVTLGSKPGEYEITATSLDDPDGGEVLVFNVYARRSNWILFLIIGLAGGLGIFLYGLNLMSDGMKKAAGDRMRTILSTVTYNRFVAVGVGAFVTMIIQSSSATTVMLVSFVQAQMMSFAQTLGIILGADIGTTITAQLIAFKITEYALLLVGIGVCIMMVARAQKIKDVGETVLGFGLLFFGMHVMSVSMDPLKTFDPFLSLLVGLENPLLGILVGTIFTALLQSSAAFIGVLIVLARPGLLTLDAAIPLLLGANIGTSITAILASINTNREAKRVALAHTIFKVIGVLLLLFWIPAFADIVRWVSPKGQAATVDTAAVAELVPRQIANAHTIFNVALTVLLLPLTAAAAGLITRILPDKEEVEKEPFKTKYLDDALISTPALALNLAKAEVLRIGAIVVDMVEKVIEPFVNRDNRVLDEIDQNEQKVDYLERKVSTYLAKTSRQSMPQERVDEVFQMMYTVTELELMADIVSKTLRPRARKWLDTNNVFSDEGTEELLDCHKRTVKQISRAIEVFKDLNLEKARAMKRKDKKYQSMEMEFMRTHFERLRKDIPETIATSEVHQDLIEQFAAIRSHATSIARIFLEWGETNKETESAPERP
ncbi:MAG: Na/Pi cotransporter family protein [Candidatus Latescibacterota bacterium]|nr:MAG: Na/Pi cotransporter family protein [Candidatus Latescibacterota bacterium]